ncbi:unnamed protein product [Chondrus crispus]|uniref:Uncharacterized protein n=1 Tax=Chondrus crispus TaxID=2769 RepID=R7Q928_CHOCR|nr:unnamed protein product [Chondrus crispus]CDF35007.1 unnamed protein product [Chondrus crispus]|eukprot:XP_005714826.1 unnamed protein product [Chondrus crispus]
MVRTCPRIKIASRNESLSNCFRITHTISNRQAARPETGATYSNPSQNKTLRKYAASDFQRVSLLN